MFDKNRKTKIRWKIGRPTKSFREKAKDLQKRQKRLYETTNKKHFYTKIIYQGTKH